MYVLDTYAALAWLANEEGADTVDAVLKEAKEAGRVKSRFHISLADSYAAGLARQRNATLVTGDPEFALPEKAGWVRIQWIT